jgi:hypothetical protein
MSGDIDLPDNSEEESEAAVLLDTEAALDAWVQEA